jgi:hypothetical protein
MIPHYVKDCNNKNVHALMPACNPVMANPIGSRLNPKQKEVVFAGAWYAYFEQRCKDAEILFDGALQSGRGLRIISRNLGGTNNNADFPERYNPCIAPALPHDTLQKVHKLYDWAINLNSVTDSTTMLAHRVFELQALGCLVLSNYSLGVERHAPLICISSSVDEVAHILDGMSAQDVYARQVDGIRFALTNNTCYDRFNQIVAAVELPILDCSRKVAVVGDMRSARVIAAFERQTYAEKTLVAPDALTASYHDFDIIAFFDDNASYGKHYLEDMINGFKYTDSDYVTKSCYLRNQNVVAGVEHNYVEAISSKYRTVFWAEAFNPQELLAMDDKTIELANGYSIDYLNYDENFQERSTEQC